MQGSLRYFPEEDTHGPWPLLKPTSNDFMFSARPKPPRIARHRPSRSKALKSLSLDLIGAVPKGAAFGIFLFALIFKPMQVVWLPSWHWIYLMVVAVGLVLLIGINRTFMISFMILTVGVFMFSWSLIISGLLPVTFWLSNWHWAYPIAGIILLVFLIGPKSALIVLLVVLTVGALWLSWSLIIIHPIILLLFIAGGILMRLIFELLYQEAL